MVLQLLQNNREGGVRLSLRAYLAFWERLPWEVREAVESRWGRPEEDPFFEGTK